MPISTLRCTCCKERFPREQMINRGVMNFCCTDHMIQYGLDKGRKEIKKKEVKRVKEAKEKLKSKQERLRELQSLFNKYIRLRDSKDGCISCDKPASWNGQWHASHLFSVGSSSALRFNLWNVHKSCSVCNNHLSGNIGEYTPRVIEKIGKEKYDWLIENKSNVPLYTIEWIEKAKRVTKKAIKRLEKRL